MSNSEGSAYDQLFYPFLFEGGKANLADVLAQVRHSTLEKCREVIALRQATLDRACEQLVDAAAAMASAFSSGGTLFAFGNGGSATDAQDMVTDLLNPPFPEREPLPAISLTNDIAVVTAVGNDVGYDKVFARQIIALGHAGDIAIGFSTSGNSQNMLVAFEQAKKQGMLTVGAAGYDGGKMAHAPYLDYCIISPCDHIPRIQEAQATVYHTLIDLVYAILAYSRKGVPV